MVMLNFPLVVVDLNGFHIGGILFECRSLAAFTTRQQHSLPLQATKMHAQAEPPEVGCRKKGSWALVRGPWGKRSRHRWYRPLDLNIGRFSRVWRL